MWRKETLLVSITFLGFAFLARGDSSRSFVISREKILDSAKQTKLKNEGIVKTIKTEHNYFISCVDVYKQPAFQHPLLQNHTIQWMPTTFPTKLSSGPRSNQRSRQIRYQKNFIKAGWMVYPGVYSDSKPRLSIYWTGDGFHKTGCYDLLYLGFIQISSGIALGLPFPRVTTHGSNYTYNLYVKIFQDATTKDWWLIVGNDIESMLVGYWPKELFPRLGGGGTVLRFGGSVMTQGREFPPMSDGYMPDGDARHSNCFHQIHYVNESNYIVPPRSLGAKVFSDNPRCYSLISIEEEKQMLGRSLYMGGPGGQC